VRLRVSISFVVVTRDS